MLSDSMKQFRSRAKYYATIRPQLVPLIDPKALNLYDILCAAHSFPSNYDGAIKELKELKWL